MEEELEGTIRIENYFHQSAGGDTATEEEGEEVTEPVNEEESTVGEEQSEFQPQVLGSLSVVDSLSAGQESWPQEKGIARGRPRGPMKAAYEPDSQKRSNKQCARKNGIVKKCSELAVITGGSVFFRFVTLEGKSYVYSSCDTVWEDYVKEGLQTLGAKEIRIDDNAKEIRKDGKTEKDTTVKTKGKSCTENGSGENGVEKKPDEKEEKQDATPKVIEIKPETEAKSTSEGKEQTKAPKPKLGRPKKDSKKAKSAPPQEEQTQQSFTIETNSTDFLNPSLQTLHIDKKYIISSADVLSENSLSLHDDENSGLANNDSSSVPIVLFPNQPAFQLDPSLVNNGASNFIPVPADAKLNPQNPQNTQKKKRKPRKRSESPEAKKEKVDVKCNVCAELYAKRQDNRRYGRWIGCSACPVWVHAKCVGWTEADVDSAKDYFCAECLKKKEEREKEAAATGESKTEEKSPNKSKEGTPKTENPKKKRKIEKAKDEKKEPTKTEENTQGSIVENTSF